MSKNTINKITFNLTSPISFIPHEPPVFDGIIAYAVYCNKYRKNTDYCTPTGKEIDMRKIESHMPIEKWKNGGFFLASRMFWKAGIEGTDSWKKRWCRRYDDIAYFGKSKRRIHTGSGPFKSFNMPIVIMSISEAWFYFQGDKDEVEKLIENHIPGIGKKVSTGYGWFDSFEITEALGDERKMVFCRPIPKEFLARNFQTITDITGAFSVRNAFGAYKPPYWLPENQTEIFWLDVEPGARK